VPPIDVQKEFCRKCESMSSMKATATFMLDQADDLFTSLQSRAFSGQL